MQLCSHLAPKEQYAQYDFKVLLPLLSCVRSFAFTKNDNGQTDVNGIKEQKKILSNCRTQISKIIDIYEKGEQLLLSKSQSPMTIQIIPNVQKIKIEKKFVSQKKDMNRVTTLTDNQKREL